VGDRPLWEYIPDEYRRMDVVSVKLNHQPIEKDEDLLTIVPQPGDELSLTPVAGVWGVVINVLVAVVLKVGEWLYTKYIAEPKQRRIEESGKLGPTYQFDIMQNTYKDGSPMPVVFGTHRCGGVVVGQHTSAGNSPWLASGRGIRVQEAGTDLLHSLIAVSEGPVESIGTCHVEGNALSNYNNASLDTALGTNSQSALQPFERVTTASAYNVQLSAGDATLAGTVASDRAIIKVTFLSGLYTVDRKGHRHRQNVGFFIRHRLTAGPGAWSSITFFGYGRRRFEPYSIYMVYEFPSKDTYDIEVNQCIQSHNPDHRSWGDAYAKEYQEVADSELRYPGVALAAIQEVANEQLSGRAPRYTFLVSGIKTQILASATTVTAAAHTQNPADLMLAMIYNRKWGIGNHINPYMQVTVNNIAGGPFTEGEVITGPASDYQFTGVVREWDSPTMIIESTQGLPYGQIDGADSGASADIVTIDECYGVNLASFWAMKEFNNEYVPDGSTTTTVDANSASGQKVLNVTSTTPFTAGDIVIINYEGDREESGTIDTVQDGVSITLLANLTYAHTAAQADVVSVAEVRHQFDFVFDGRDNGWDALERIAKTCRTMVVRYGSYIDVVPLKSETPGQLVTMGNIKRSTFKKSYGELGIRPNRLNVVYLDRNLDYRRHVAPMEDEAAYTAGEKVLQEEVELYGVTRESQANREGYFRLKRLRYTSNVIEFEMGLDCLDFEVGDVFRFQHAVPGTGTQGGRVVSATASTVTLDHPVTISGGEAIRVKHEDDTQDDQTLTSAAGEHKTISISPAVWDTTPVYGEVYGIGTLGQYRCMSLKLKDDQTAFIQAEEDDSAYYTDDYGTLPTFTETTLPDPDHIPDDVTDITLSEASEVRDGVLRNILNVNFVKPVSESYAAAHVHWKRGYGAWMEFGEKLDDGETVSNDTFNYPEGICTDGDYIYLCDTLNHRIIKMEMDFTYVSKIGSEGNGNDEFQSPGAITTNGTHLWVADSGNSRIVKRLCADLSYVDELGTYGVGADQFKYPRGIEHDGTDDVYIADTYNHRIVRLDDALDGNAGAGTWVTLGAIGAGNDQFDAPHDICYISGYVFVADTQNHCIVKVDDALTGFGGGTFTREGSQGYTADTFCGPRGITTDGTHIWISDGGTPGGADYTMYSRIMKRLCSTMAAVSEWGGAVGDGPDQMNLPFGIEIDTETNAVFYYVVDRINSRIVRRDISPDSSWNYAGRTETGHLRIEEEFREGSYITVAVVSEARYGQKKHVEDAPTESIHIGRLAAVPRDVPALYMQPCSRAGYGTLRWDEANDPYISYYRVKFGSDWETGRFIGNKKIYAKELAVKTAQGASGTWWIKSYNAGGRPCANATSVTQDNPCPFSMIVGHSGAIAQTLNFRTG
jgi:hypothetical protein